MFNFYTELESLSNNSSSTDEDILQFLSLHKESIKDLIKDAILHNHGRYTNVMNSLICTLAISPEFLQKMYDNYDSGIQSLKLIEIPDYDDF